MCFLIWAFSSKFYCRMEIVQRLFTMLPNENISSIYLHQIFGICHEKSWIRRFKHCFYCGFMFLDFFLKVSKFKSIIFQYYFPKFFQGITLDLLVMLSLEQERSQFVCVCVFCFFCLFFFFGGVGGRGRGQLRHSFPTLLKFPDQKMSNSFSFKHQGYCLL